MEKKPYHHLSDGSFRNPKGSPERDSNFKWSFKIFNKEKKKLDMKIPKDHVIEKKIVLSNPIKTVKFIARQSASFIILNPFHIYSDNKFYSGSFYYHSETHKKLLPYRIIYSFIVYLICIIGLISLIKLRNKNTLIFILLSAIYFFSILSWHGNNRYFTPILIYISFLFGSGTNEIAKIIKRNLIK